MRNFGIDQTQHRERKCACFASTILKDAIALKSSTQNHNSYCLNFETLLEAHLSLCNQMLLRLDDNWQRCRLNARRSLEFERINAFEQLGREAQFLLYHPPQPKTTNRLKQKYRKISKTKPINKTSKKQINKQCIKTKK